MWNPIFADAATSGIDQTTMYTFVFVTITFMIYLYIGWQSRIRESQGFYVAGRGVPAIANGAATAADWMSAASFMGMAGAITMLGCDGSMYLMGWTGGYVLLALLLAPYLRKFGQFTVPDFVGARYYSETARVVAAVCAVFVSLTYVAGQMRGVGIVFSRFLQVPVWQGVIVGMVIVAFFAVLGGMKGITWTQVVQYFVLILAFLIPSIALASMLTNSPVPQLSLITDNISSNLDSLQVELGFHEYTKPFTSGDQPGSWGARLEVFCLTFALMAGTAGLPHVIVRFYTVPNVRAARYSAGWALLFIAILYTCAPALALFARYNLLNNLHEATVDRIEVELPKNDDGTPNITTFEVAKADDSTRPALYAGLTKTIEGSKGKAKVHYHLHDKEGQPIVWTDRWQRTDLIKFNDTDANGKINLNAKKNEAGKIIGFQDASIDKDTIVLSTPEVAKLAPWVIAIVATGGLAAALSTAAGLLLVISSSIAHDLYIHFMDPNASEEKRVKVGRIMILFGIVVAGYFGISPPGFVAEVVAFAFGLAAASFFPIILLGIFDKRTNREGAVAGMIVGLVFTGVYILGCQADKIFGAFGVTEPFFGHWCFGISPKGIGTIGCLLNFIVTLTVSRLTPPPPQEVQDFVENVRVPMAQTGKDYEI